MKLLRLIKQELWIPLNREFMGILLVLAIFFGFPYLVRLLDNTAAAIDPGVLSAVLLAVVSLMIFQAATWWVLCTIWRVFSSYSMYHFENNFKSLEPWQKVCIYLCFYLLVLYSFIGTLNAFI